MDLSKSMHVLTWEVTKACQLHCRHCRARAIPHRNAGELTVTEISAVLDDMAEKFTFKPVVVFTGGDPSEREDLDEILEASISRGFITSISPSVTPRITDELVHHWADMGVRAISLSIDGPNPQIHDRFRGVKGTFDRSIQVAHAVVDSGMSLQLNTSVGRFTLEGLEAMGDLAKSLQVSSWEVFFVIPMGRANLKSSLEAEENERVLEYLADYQGKVGFRVTAVGAPHYVRVQHEGGYMGDQPPRQIVREARGFAFIDHLGEVYPSGYLPLSGGNVRERSIVDIYRNSELFTSLRDPSQFAGGCGECAYGLACGGSRARAYAVFGDPLAPDPGCVRSGAALPSPSQADIVGARP
ncbi:MAG: radical SAM protein [Actinomycetota bacterium]|nr:radical SAM protein [Actinomycetota bacterium]